MNVAEFDRCLWHNRARALYATDGDTLVARPELGYVRDLGMSVSYRLRDCYADELPKGFSRGGPYDESHPGVAAWLFLQNLLRSPYTVDGFVSLRVRTYEKERATVDIGGFVKSFDRWIADVWRVEPDGKLTDLAEALAAAGHATRVAP